MNQQDHPASFWDLPTELQREIFSYFPYWELQKRRGVSRTWCVITDSLNPDYQDAQSKRVATFSEKSVKLVEARFDPISWWAPKLVKMNNWKNEEICYPRNASFLIIVNEKVQISNITEFLKWDATPHYCSFIDDCPSGYYRNNEFHRTICKCCESCCSKKRIGGPNHFADKCKNKLCGQCCTDLTCQRHFRYPRQTTK